MTTVASYRIPFVCSLVCAHRKKNTYTHTLNSPIESSAHSHAHTYTLKRRRAYDKKTTKTTKYTSLTTRNPNLA